MPHYCKYCKTTLSTYLPWPTAIPCILAVRILIAADDIFICGGHGVNLRHQNNTPGQAVCLKIPQSIGRQIQGSALCHPKDPGDGTLNNPHLLTIKIFLP